MSAGQDRLLVWAPTGNDGPLIRDLLTAAGIDVAIITSVSGFGEALAHGAGAAFIAREALDARAMQEVSERLKAEPGWSKLPILLVTWRGAESGATLFSLAEPFVSVANVVFLERPFTSDVLLGAVRFALRSRLAQYELRDLTARLDRSAEELGRSNRELEQFAAVAAHDLQEPLRTMASYADLLGKRYGPKLDDKGREFCTRIADGAMRLSLQIASIKEYSLAGRAEIAARRIELADPVRVSLANLQQMIAVREATITCGPLPQVHGDPTQLVVVFQNLISNAIKYAVATPVIRIEASEDRGEWRISVSDNGPGIDPRDQQRIFDIFTRLQAIGVSGSGIGLATCKRVVERHGGRIGVQSSPGAGSIFWFTLPMKGPSGETVPDS